VFYDSANEAQDTVKYHLKMYLFRGRDRRRVLPGCTCDIYQTWNAISRHA